MVSKLLLAVQEVALSAAAEGAAPAEIEALINAYYDIRGGLGFNKTPESFGAFPTDPYSHTPAGAGAKQPGMTGQVKEEVITRFAELGVTVSKGAITFSPVLLRRSEFLASDATLQYLDVAGEPRSLALESGSFGFTICQVPVICRLSKDQRITITYRSGEQQQLLGLAVGVEASAHVFARDGQVERIDVSMLPETGPTE
jgi:hypothetical protein